MSVTKTTCLHGIAIAMSDGMIYPLTPCHQASGKGSEVPTGVVCRSCYEEVDPLYGDCDVAYETTRLAAWLNEQGCPTPDACKSIVLGRLVVQA